MAWRQALSDLADAMIERELHIEADGARLTGTLCFPSGSRRCPMVLMIHGSGPLDRDENMRGQDLNVFSGIAHALASVGVGSLRYDKRGCGASTGDYYTAGHMDLVEDAVAWFDTLRPLEICADVFVLGHSEGCLIAAELSLKRPAVAGLVLLCPFVEAMESILMRQAHQLETELGAQEGIGGLLQRAALGVVGRPVTSQRKLLRKLESFSADTFRLRFQRVPAKWLRELLSLDASAIYSEVECPVLLVGGEKDIQCDPADVDRIAALVTGEADVRRFDDLTHVLRRSDDPASFLGVRPLLAKPVDPFVLTLIAEWVAGGGALPSTTPARPAPTRTTRRFVRTSAVLEIHGPDVDPSEVTRLLKLPPGDTHREGELKITRSSIGKISVYGRHETGSWSMSSRRWVDSPRLSVHIDWVLGEIETRAEELGRILADGAVAEITGYSEGKTRAPPGVPDVLLERAASLGVSIKLNHRILH